MKPFDQAKFDAETSRNFDSKEIASVIARYDAEAAALLKDVSESSLSVI